MASNFIDLPGYGDVHWKAPVATAADLPSTNNSDGDARTTQDLGGLYVWDGSSWVASGGGGGSGTVTSVAMTVPSFLSVAGSPITTSGTFAVTLATESANTIFAGPTTGAAATPTFRAMVVADLPLFTANSFITTDGSGVLQAGGLASTIVTLTGTQTLTNKTLTAPIISTISNTGTLTLPTSTDTLVGRATTDTLTNKTLTAPIIATISNSGTITIPTGTDTLVGKATTDTLTNKTLSAAAVTSTLKAGNYHIEPLEYDAGNSSTAQTIDWTNASSQKSTLTGSVTYTFSNGVAGGAYVLKIATGAGSFTATWPAAVKWAGGTAPTITTTASRVDLINFYYDGTTYFGTFSQNYTP